MKTDNTKSEIVWKGFRLGNLFEWSGKHRISKTAKQYDTIEEPRDGYIANITAGKYNDGIANFIPEDDEINSKKRIDALTVSSNGNVGACFFHDYYFISTGDSALLENKYDKLQEIFDTNHIVPRFFAKLITKMFMNGLYSWGYKVSKELFNREIILLPCLEVSENDEYIWEENGRYYTLAVEYIKELMEKAKERKEARTIRMYEAERAKYEAERAKYEAGYNAEKPNVLWKGFRLGNLFEESAEHYLEKSKKNYNINDVKTDDYPVAVCSASKYNNGIVGYIAETDDVSIKKRKGYITKGGFGHFFYQDDWFIKPGGSWGMLNIIKFKDDKLKTICDLNIDIYYFLCRILTNIFEPMCSFGYAVPFDREIILLPCLEVSENDEYIWEENGRYYTLATNYISYLYLTGKVNKYQKLIDTYTYTY